MDQRAETELGRLVLRGVLDETLGLAGETYLGLWRGYVMSIAGPAELGHGGGHGFTCDGCATAEAWRWCRCLMRRRIYEEAQRMLLREGAPVSIATTCVVVHDLPALDVELVRCGLTALAVHFGLRPRNGGRLQRGKAAVLGNAASSSAREQA